MPADAAPERAVRAQLEAHARARTSRSRTASTACEPHVQRDSDDEHAVSTLEHGPCMPSTNDRLAPPPTPLSPVTAYTEPPAGADGGCASAQSGRSMPTKTPPSPPSSAAAGECDDRAAPSSRLEQQPLLRIHGARLRRRDAEGGRVEAMRAGDKAAVAHTRAPNARSQRAHIHRLC